jgi:hypothetical protein
MVFTPSSCFLSASEYKPAQYFIRAHTWYTISIGFLRITFSKHALFRAF